MDLQRKLAAEFIGTFWLVLGGCGSVVLAAGVPTLGIGYAGVALAFGITLLTGAYAFGHISGAHFNPAVTFGVWSAGKLPTSHVIPYWVAQVIGGIVAASVLYLIASGKAGFDVTAGFASNGFGEHSPQGYSLHAAMVCEVVMSFMFLMVILGSTSEKAPANFGPLAFSPAGDRILYARWEQDDTTGIFSNQALWTIRLDGTEAELLVTRGADPDFRDRQGRTALDLASRPARGAANENREKVVSLLRSVTKSVPATAPEPSEASTP